MKNSETQSRKLAAELLACAKLVADDSDTAGELAKEVVAISTSGGRRRLTTVMHFKWFI